MLDDIKALLIERYGDRWLNSINNQNGIAEDLSIFEKDIMRVSRKFGLVGRGMFLSAETEVVARYEVIKPIKTLFDLDAVFYGWWGNRASENISFVQREIADDEVIYHFITGTPTHGHSGRIILMGREVRAVIQKRWDRRIKKLNAASPVLSEETSPVDKSSNN
jgi:hypothetical protein